MLLLRLLRTKKTTTLQQQYVGGSLLFLKTRALNLTHFAFFVLLRVIHKAPNQFSPDKLSDAQIDAFLSDFLLYLKCERASGRLWAHFFS